MRSFMVLFLVFSMKNGKGIMFKNQKGFTLIELMIGVAIVFVLVMVVSSAFIGNHFIQKHW